MSKSSQGNSACFLPEITDTQRILLIGHTLVSRALPVYNLFSISHYD